MVWVIALNKREKQNYYREYRPFSVLPVLSKSNETDYNKNLGQNMIIDDFRSAFCSASSTETSNNILSWWQNKVRYGRWSNIPVYGNGINCRSKVLRHSRILHPGKKTKRYWYWCGWSYKIMVQVTSVRKKKWKWKWCQMLGMFYNGVPFLACLPSLFISVLQFKV